MTLSVVQSHTNVNPFPPSGQTCSPTTSKSVRSGSRSIPSCDRADPSPNASRSLTGSLSRDHHSSADATTLSGPRGAAAADDAATATASCSSMAMSFGDYLEPSRPHSAQPLSRRENALDFMSSLPALNLGKGQCLHLASKVASRLRFCLEVQRIK